MIEAIIFSRDRAMQLDLLLRSIDRHASHLIGRTRVIYKATDAWHGLAYCKALEGRKYDWEEGRFEEDVREAVEAIESERIVFFTDDCVFYRPAPPTIQRCAVYALRMGLNCSYCHPLGREQALPVWQPMPGGICWDPSAETSECDWAYPMALDGHVYRTEKFRELLGKVKFSSPNELEHALHMLTLGAWPPVMDAPQLSCLVSIPANRVNEGFPNPCSSDPTYAPDRLCRMFLDGWRIDLDAIERTDVTGAHQEIPYEFVLEPARAAQGIS